MLRIVAKHASKEGGRNGTAFLVALRGEQQRSVLLTALHIVADVSLSSSTDDPVVTWAHLIRCAYRPLIGDEYGKPHPLNLRRIAYDVWGDWAAFEVLAPDGARRFKTSNYKKGKFKTDDTWHTYGFPPSEDEHSDGVGACGQFVTGGTARRHKVGHVQKILDRIELTSPQLAASQPRIARGYSGAPLVVKDAVVGIILSRDPVLDDTGPLEGAAKAGTLYALPIERIRPALKNHGYDLATTSLPAPTSHRQKNTKGQSGSNRISSTPTQLKKTLSPWQKSALPITILITLAISISPEKQSHPPEEETPESDLEHLSSTEQLPGVDNSPHADTCRASAVAKAESIHDIKIADAAWTNCNTQDTLFYRTGPDLFDYDEDSFLAYKPRAGICKYEIQELDWKCTPSYWLAPHEYNFIVGCDPASDGYCSSSWRGSGATPLLIQDFDDDGSLDFGYKATSYIDLDHSEYRTYWGAWFTPSTSKIGAAARSSFVICTSNGIDGYGNRVKNQCITSPSVDRGFHSRIIQELRSDNMLGPKDHTLERWNREQHPSISTNGLVHAIEADLSVLLHQGYSPVAPGYSAEDTEGGWYVVLRSTIVRDVKLLIRLRRHPKNCFAENEPGGYETIGEPATYHIQPDADCNDIRNIEIVYAWVSHDHDQWTSKITSTQDSIWIIENPNIATSFMHSTARLRRFRFNITTELRSINSNEGKVFGCTSALHGSECQPLSAAEEIPVVPRTPVAHTSASRRIWLDDGVLRWSTIKPLQSGKNCKGADDCTAFDLGIIRVVPPRVALRKLWPADLAISETQDLSSLSVVTAGGGKLSLRQLCSRLRCEGFSLVLQAELATKDDLLAIGSFYIKPVSHNMSHLTWNLGSLEELEAQDIVSLVDFHSIQRSKVRFDGEPSWISLEMGEVREWDGSYSKAVDTKTMPKIRPKEAQRGEKLLREFLECFAEDGNEQDGNEQDGNEQDGNEQDGNEQDPDLLEALGRLGDCDSTSLRDMQFIARLLLGDSLGLTSGTLEYGGLLFSEGRESLDEALVAPSFSTSRWRTVEAGAPCSDDNDCARPAGGSLECSNNACDYRPCSL